VYLILLYIYFAIILTKKNFFCSFFFSFFVYFIFKKFCFYINNSKLFLNIESDCTYSKNIPNINLFNKKIQIKISLFSNLYIKQLFNCRYILGI